MSDRINYEEKLRTLADTILYEEALKICEQNLKNFADSNHESHWKNGFIHSEFWRRNKGKIYYNAYNSIQLRYGREQAAIPH